MKRIEILMHGDRAGLLSQVSDGYDFVYNKTYTGSPISLALPIVEESYHFDMLPPFLEALLPEVHVIRGVIKKHKLNPNDMLSVLCLIGGDTFGALTIKAMP